MSGRKRDEILLRLGREFQVHDEALQESDVELSVITGRRRERIQKLWWRAITAAAGLPARSPGGLAVKAIMLAAVIRTDGLEPSVLRDLAESLCNDLIRNAGARGYPP